MWEHIYALFLKLICSSFSDRLCTFLKISNFLNQIKCSCTVFPWFSFQKKSEIFPCNLWRPYLAGFCGNVETTFRQPSSKIAISLHSPQPLTVMVATGQAAAWKKKITRKKWNLGNLCWNGAKLPFLFTLPQPSRSWSSGLGQPRRAFFGACCSTDYYRQKREIQKCSDMRNHDIWIYLNRNTFAPATIPPALKRSLANIHTHVLACADENELEPGTHFTSKHSVKKLLENRAHNISYIYSGWCNCIRFVWGLQFLGDLNLCPYISTWKSSKEQTLLRTKVHFL